MNVEMFFLTTSGTGITSPFDLIRLYFFRDERRNNRGPRFFENCRTNRVLDICVENFWTFQNVQSDGMIYVTFSLPV